VTTGCAFAIRQHVIFGRRVLRIVVEDHDLIGEEFLLGGAHGLPATTGEDKSEEE
jgi:hypothetical protein